MNIQKYKPVTLREKIFSVPARIDPKMDFCFPDWSSPMLFDNPNPVKIEFCSGNGAWIAAQALAFPEYNWVAVEKKWIRARKIYSKVKKHALNNFILIYGEGLQIASSFLPTSTVQEVFINFPDPWPKRRHWKNRIVNQHFLLEMDRILAAQGLVTFVTDDAEYSRVMLQEFSNSTSFHSNFSEPFYRTEWPEYGSSYFEDLWRSKGKTIMYHQFVKK